MEAHGSGANELRADGVGPHELVAPELGPPEYHGLGANEVRADAELLTCEPAEELPMAQRYFLF